MTYPWPQDVLSAIKSGEISPSEAFRILQEMDNIVPRADSAGAQYSQAQRIDNILHELDNLIGLTEVKKLVREIYAFIEIQKRREKEKLNTEPLVLHMIFKGNPGTGKTTVARILGKIFNEMGVLSRGHLIEVERADLVGEYIGHTAQKTREQLKKAYGGILFIDEAYSLARGGEKDFGKEAIDCMVKAMEDHKDELILILAGYQKEMENFLQTNPGLKSRFPIHINFPDYHEPELMQIAEQMCLKRQYQLTSQTKAALIKVLNLSEKGAEENFGNARTVRNIIEKAIRRQAVRLISKQHISREELMLIEPGDLAEVGQCESV
ncbi:MAG TPA: stage V sporulation protein K [Methylomusa anaerophila]|uniref:Stage V sporulation protein K n=1 Tax=Methylomusa anaerophila TaxID=1930071 RepID=A0A348APU5_9FIRM|nr:stage V sporulation protein K [Methylomusa anaerophila]BBB93093.1 stage V sporulation protein K [Methylomusa anaerophila]HML87074.1 stage V sporulation protein K [Methylomusa anaerophila]